MEAQRYDKNTIPLFLATQKQLQENLDNEKQLQTCSEQQKTTAESLKTPSGANPTGPSNYSVCVFYLSNRDTLISK